MTQKYVAGSLIEDVAAFTADDDVTPVDPTTITVKYQIAYAGAVSGPFTITYASATVPAPHTIARTAPGVYEVQLDTTLLPGYWTYQWNGTGTGQAVLPVAALVYPAPL
jgi:hypothetical protein